MGKVDESYNWTFYCWKNSDLLLLLGNVTTIPVVAILLEMKSHGFTRFKGSVFAVFLAKIHFDYVEKLLMHWNILDVRGFVIFRRGYILYFSQDMCDLISHNCASSHIRFDTQLSFDTVFVRDIPSHHVLEQEIQIGKFPIGKYAEIKKLNFHFPILSLVILSAGFSRDIICKLLC